MQRTSFADFHCSLTRTLDVVSDGGHRYSCVDIAVGVTRFVGDAARPRLLAQSAQSVP
jgi:hypothetical protein